MEKKERYKQFTNKEDINNKINFLRKYNVPFKVTLSNYTTKIEYQNKIITHITENMDLKTFSVFNKIKKDLKEYTANENPLILKKDLVYFELMKEQIFENATVYCVDIKSAYATILKNDGFISPETFTYLNTLTKKQRLAAVGMLAARKDIFLFNGRELQGHQKQVKETENYFWYAVKRTGEIMRSIAFDSAVFFWVDGIYFLNICDAYKAINTLKENDFKSSFKVCNEFYYDNSENGSVYKCFFYEGKKEENNFKIFNLSKPEKTKEVLISFFLNKHKLYLPNE